MKTLASILVSAVVALSVSLNAHAERWLAETEELVRMDAVVAVITISEFGPALPAKVPEWRSAEPLNEWAKAKTEKVLTGTLENEFRYLKPRRLEKDTRYLAFLKKTVSPGEYQNLPAENNVEALSADPVQADLRIKAVTEIIRVEKLEDQQTRFQTQVSLLDSDNEHLRLYAIRKLARGAGNWRGRADDPKRVEMFNDIQDILIKFIKNSKADRERQYALRSIFFYSFDRKLWPEKLIAACMDIAASDPSAGVRRNAVSAVHGMCQTGLLGPKHSYDAVLPKLTALLAKESDRLTTKDLAYAITVIGQMKHRKLLDDLKDLTPEKAFYVSAVIKHWQAEGDSAQNIDSREFDYTEKEK